jgi:hypothetical protein
MSHLCANQERAFEGTIGAQGSRRSLRDVCLAKSSSDNYSTGEHTANLLPSKSHCLNKITYIIASALNQGGTPSGAGELEDVPQARTLSALYALVSGTEARPTQHTLEFLGSWELDCLANSVNILTNPDGEFAPLPSAFT